MGPIPFPGPRPLTPEPRSESPRLAETSGKPELGGEMSTTNADSLLRESAFAFAGMNRYRLSLRGGLPAARCKLPAVPRLSEIAGREGPGKQTGMGAGRAWRKATKAATPPYIQEVGLWRSGPFKSRASGDE